MFEVCFNAPSGQPAVYDHSGHNKQSRVQKRRGLLRTPCDDRNACVTKGCGGRGSWEGGGSDEMEGFQMLVGHEWLGHDKQTRKAIRSMDEPN